jgi:photosystem I subunit III
MKKLLAAFLVLAIWFSITPMASAANTPLSPCKDSPVFLERSHSAPNNYYFNKPNQSYSQYLLCGEDGLPHLKLSLDHAVDIAIPFSIFLYFAGFIGWSGRAYLRTASTSSDPEQKEIFIDLPLAILSFSKGLLWPLLAIQELASGDLTAKDDQISISPR